jgi:hypothetical protein
MTEWDLYEFFKEQRRRELAARYARPDPRRVLAREAEQAVAERLEEMGYRVNPTSRNARYDLLVEDATRVEVKASTYNEATGHRGSRYQAHFHNEADLLVFACRNGSWYFFVIPAQDLGGRRNLAVWSEDPRDYVGQWMGYLEAWDYVPQVVEEARNGREYQLSLL